MLNLILALNEPLEPAEGGPYWATGGVATFQGFEWIFNNIVVVILSLAGIVLFIMLLLGGFKYLTSGGDPKKAESAKQTLTYAISGIVLIALAYLILKFIGDFTGAQLTDFKVYLPN